MATAWLTGSAKRKEQPYITAKLQELESQLHARHLHLSPEALEDVFAAWREQVTDSLGRQDIQAARIIIERFIIKIELGYDEVRIRYRYPLGTGVGAGSEREMLEAEPIERSLHDMDQKNIQSIYQLAPHLAEKPLPPRKPRSVNPRDLEIYRLHIVENITVRELAGKYGLTMKSIRGICKRIRKLETVS